MEERKVKNSLEKNKMSKDNYNKDHSIMNVQDILSVNLVFYYNLLTYQYDPPQKDIFLFP